MSYSSLLETSGQRFLSLCLQQALADRWLSPEDFADAFSPEVVMAALEQAPVLRSRVLVEAAGVHEKIAPKKSTVAAAEDLQIALSEGVCTPTTLIELFGMDDRVRYLPTSELWSLLTRDSFWKQSSDRARVRMHAVLTAGLEQELIGLGDVIDAVTAERLAADLPKPLLEKALTRAIVEGRANVAFTAELVFEALPLEEWVTHVPLPVLWEKVVEGRILPATGWAPVVAAAPATEGDKGDKKGASATQGEKSAVGEKKLGGPSSPKALNKSSEPAEKKQDGASSSSAAAPAASAPSASAPSQEEIPISVRPAEEDEARTHAIETLKALDRLPVRVEELDTPTLLAIESMYAELLATSDDEEREQIIRDAFPNAAMLEQALFAVAEALDPRLTQENLRARGAEGEALIPLVLFEERRRNSNRASVLPPPLPGATPGSVAPPPLPNAGPGARSVPPPLPQAPRGRGS